MATGISISTTSSLTSGQKTFVANAMMAFEPAAPDPDLVRSERLPPGHLQWNLLTYERLAQGTQLTQGVDLSRVEQLVVAVLTLNPDEHGILTLLSHKLVRRQASDNVVATAGQLVGGGLRRRMANDIIALYDGFSKSIVGAGSPLDVTYFRGAVAYLLTDNSATVGPAPMPLVGALHIEQISDIVLDISDPGAVISSRFGWSQELMQNWWRARDRLYAVEIFHSGNIARDTSDDSKGAIFAREALVIAMETDAEPTEEVDHSLRATEYGLFQSWTEGERADAHGVEVYSDTIATV